MIAFDLIVIGFLLCLLTVGSAAMLLGALRVFSDRRRALRRVLRRRRNDLRNPKH